MKEILNKALDDGIREIEIKNMQGKKASSITLHINVHDKEKFISHLIKTGATATVENNKIVLSGGIYNE